MKIGPPDLGTTYEVWFVVAGTSWLLATVDTYEGAVIMVSGMAPEARECVHVIKNVRSMTSIGEQGS